MVSESKLLFGGTSGWSSQDWTASDDRVRGGRSQSYLSCSPGDTAAKFYGELDIETLGGAGFASQRTASDDLRFDLSKYDGIQLVVAGADTKQYTLILKDTLLPQSENGREQAGISWEYDFYISLAFRPDPEMLICIPWSQFTATYRGKKIDDAPPLDTSNIRRISFMLRSFFGSQKGPFGMSIVSLSAYKTDDGVTDNERLTRVSTTDRERAMSQSRFPYPYQDYPQYQQTDAFDEKQPENGASKSEGRGGWFCGLLGR